MLLEKNYATRLDVGLKSKYSFNLGRIREQLLLFHPIKHGFRELYKSTLVITLSKPEKNSMTVTLAPNVNHDHTGTWKGLLQPGQHASLLGFLFPLDLRTRGRVWFYKL